MSFLSAAFLLALPLVAVPVVDPSVSRPPAGCDPLGRDAISGRAVTKGRRMERFEELLLMMLRLAAVAALVLALARPMVRSSWLGNDTQRQVILMLDNSLSMSREVDGQSAGNRMQQQALQIIDSLSSGDSVQVLLAAGSQWATADGIAADSAGQTAAPQHREEVEPTQGTADRLAACSRPSTFNRPSTRRTPRLSSLPTARREVGMPTPKSPWQQLAAKRDAAQFPVSLEVVDCGLESGTSTTLP